MTSAFGAVNWKDVGSAVLSAVIAAVLAYLGSLASIWNVDWSAVLNIAVLTAVSSLVKAFGFNPTTGKVFGMVSIRAPQA